MPKQQFNNFDISGHVCEIGGIERYSEKFSKRVLVIEVFADKNFKQQVPFEFSNRHMIQLTEVKVGDYVTINFQLRGRKYDKNGQFFRNPVLEGILCHVE